MKRYLSLRADQISLINDLMESGGQCLCKREIDPDESCGLIAQPRSSKVPMHAETLEVAVICFDCYWQFRRLLKVLVVPWKRRVLRLILEAMG